MLPPFLCLWETPTSVTVGVVSLPLGEGVIFRRKMTDEGEKTPRSNLSAVLFFFKFNYVGNFTVKRIAKGIKGFCVYTFAFFNSV